MLAPNWRKPQDFKINLNFDVAKCRETSDEDEWRAKLLVPRLRLHGGTCEFLKFSIFEKWTF